MEHWLGVAVASSAIVDHDVIDEHVVDLPSTILKAAACCIVCFDMTLQLQHGQPVPEQADLPDTCMESTGQAGHC